MYVVMSRCFSCGADAIVKSLTNLKDDETLLVQSGKPVGVFQTHEWAPRVLLANSNLVGDWATWPEFRRLEQLGLTMYGQMTAGSWIYIGSQGIVQGTYETFVEIGRRHYGGSHAGKWILTAGLGGMGGAQPLAATMNGAAALVVEVEDLLVVGEREGAAAPAGSGKVAQPSGKSRGKKRRNSSMSDSNTVHPFPRK